MGSYGKSMSRFVRNHNAVFPSGCPVSPSHGATTRWTSPGTCRVCRQSSVRPVSLPLGPSRGVGGAVRERPQPRSHQRHTWEGALRVHGSGAPRAAIPLDPVSFQLRSRPARPRERRQGSASCWSPRAEAGGDGGGYHAVWPAPVFLISHLQIEILSSSKADTLQLATCGGCGRAWHTEAATSAQGLAELFWTQESLS